MSWCLCVSVFVCVCVRRASAGPGREAPCCSAELEQRRQRRTLRPEERERHPAQGQLLCDCVTVYLCDCLTVWLLTCQFTSETTHPSAHPSPGTILFVSVFFWDGSLFLLVDTWTDTNTDVPCFPRALVLGFRWWSQFLRVTEQELLLQNSKLLGLSESLI